MHWAPRAENCETIAENANKEKESRKMEGNRPQIAPICEGIATHYQEMRPKNTRGREKCDDNMQERKCERVKDNRQENAKNAEEIGNKPQRIERSSYKVRLMRK